MTRQERLDLYTLIDRTLAGEAGAAEKLALAFAETSHDAMCPQRVGGECLCIKNDMATALYHTPEDQP